MWDCAGRVLAERRWDGVGGAAFGVCLWDYVGSASVGLRRKRNGWTALGVCRWLFVPTDWNPRVFSTGILLKNYVGVPAAAGCRACNATEMFAVAWPRIEKYPGGRFLYSKIPR